MPSRRREVERSWDRTRGHLNAAVACLHPDSDGRECDELLRRHQEYLDVNELELALDELEALGDLLHERGSFWWHLLLAAEEMGFEQHAERIRQKWAG